MANLEPAYLDSFRTWLEHLGTDVLELSTLLKEDSALIKAARAVDSPETDGPPEALAARQIAGALNYLFKSLDLIPDGVEELGYLDDTFILRVSAGLASEKLDPCPEPLARLSNDVRLIEQFLGAEDFGRLKRYAENASTLAVRARAPAEILNQDEILNGFLAEVKAWAQEYQPPAFERDDKNLIRLRSFLATKLPS